MVVLVATPGRVFVTLVAFFRWCGCGFDENACLLGVREAGVVLTVSIGTEHCMCSMCMHSFCDGVQA